MPWDKLIRIILYPGTRRNFDTNIAWIRVVTLLHPDKYFSIMWTGFPNWIKMPKIVWRPISCIIQSIAWYFFGFKTSYVRMQQRQHCWIIYIKKTCFRPLICFYLTIIYLSFTNKRIDKSIMYCNKPWFTNFDWIFFLKTELTCS